MLLKGFSEVQMQVHPLTRGAEHTLSRLKNLGPAEKIWTSLKICEWGWLQVLSETSVDGGAGTLGA